MRMAICVPISVALVACGGTAREGGMARPETGTAALVAPAPQTAPGTATGSGTGTGTGTGTGAGQQAAAQTGAASACPAESGWPEGMACVLGGTFLRGSEEGLPDERPRAEVYVDTFYMDKYEVTNAEYGPCIESGRCRRPMPFRHYMAPRQPIVAISWFDAVAYCEMHGKRLPTEAEFERAATGPGPTPTRFAWGDEPWVRGNGPAAVAAARQACAEHAIIKTSEGEGCGRGTTFPVGSRPATHFGLFDIAGNLWEWTADWYSPCYRGCEGECGEECFGRNPRGPCGGAASCSRRAHGLRVLRGGSWWYPLERARAAARRGSGGPNRGPHRFGFRCARDLVAPPPAAPAATPP